MKAHLYKLLMLLAVFMPTVTLRAEEVTGISDPFVFGSPVATPLSSLPLVVVFMLIGVLVILHYYRTKKQAL